MPQNILQLPELLDELARPLEMIDHLIYLARHGAKDPALVEAYLGSAQRQMEQVRQMLK